MKEITVVGIHAGEIHFDNSGSLTNPYDCTGFTGQT